MKTAIVTGTTGFIGAAVAKDLLVAGYKVYGLGRRFDRVPELLETTGFIPVQVELEAYDKLEEHVPAYGADVFYHFAWQGGFERERLEDYALQLDNAKHACDAVKSAIKLRAKKFVYAATINEIEIQQFINDFPSFQTRPTCIYATAKLAADLICRTIAQSSHLPYCAGIIPMLYGVGNRSRQLVNIVLEQLMNGERPKLIEGNNLYDLVAVEDVARAFRLIGEQGRDGMRYYVGHAQLKTFRVWMEDMAKAIDSSAKLRFGDYDDPLDLDYSLLDLEALHDETGYVPEADFEESIRKTAKWLLKEDAGMNNAAKKLVNNPMGGGNVK